MVKNNRSTGNLLMCITEILIGLLLLINPIGFMTSIIIALGIAMTVLGIGCLISYFHMDADTAVEKNDLAKGLILPFSVSSASLKQNGLL